MNFKLEDANVGEVVVKVSRDSRSARHQFCLVNI